MSDDRLPGLRVTTLDFPTIEDLPENLRGEVERRRGLNVFRMLMHTPNSVPSFLAMTDALRDVNTFPKDLRELAILRVGWRYAARYELFHHERIGKFVGLGDAAIAAAKEGPTASGLSSDEALVLRMTDELLDEHGLSQTSRDEALRRFSNNELADLILTIGHYQQVCIFLNTFGVPVEEGV